MTGFAAYILTALALVLVIEGLLYCLFPDVIRRLMAQALSLPVGQLRLFGFVVAVTGFCLIWLLSIL